MAGDWIKMRIDLQSHPKVVRILSATQSDKFRVIGGLHAVWSVFDTHSEDGILRGYTPELLDHIIGWAGFSSAMLSVGWLALDSDESMKMPEFSEHNGKSGKRRAEDQKRKRRDRNACPQSVRKVSADEVDEKRTREEKRRDINNKGDYTADFLSFWDAWPNGFGSKGNKSEAAQAWRTVRNRPPLHDLISAVEAQHANKSAQQAAGEFVVPFKHVCRWLKLRGWESDESETVVSTGEFVL